MKGIALTSLLIVSVAALSGCGGASESTNDTTNAKSKPRPRPKLVENPSPADLKLDSKSTLAKEDCEPLTRIPTGELHWLIKGIESSPGRPVSSCTLRTSGGTIGVSLDMTRPVRKRFLARIGSTRVRGIIDLGVPTEGKAGAYWSNDTNHLYVYGGAGWFEIYLPRKVPESLAQTMAVRIARLALEVAAL